MDWLWGLSIHKAAIPLPPPFAMFISSLAWLLHQFPLLPRRMGPAVPLVPADNIEPPGAYPLSRIFLVLDKLPSPV